MRRLRFSVFSLLILTTVVAVLISLAALRERRQRNAVAQLNRLGGYVGYDFGEHYFDRDSPKPSWLVRTLGPDWFYSVVQIELRNVTDDDLKWLRALPSTETLTIEHSSISQQGMSHIAPLGKLESLALLKCPGVDDRALAHLSGNRALKNLVLLDTSITDASLAMVADLPAIEVVSILDQGITDRGVEAFRNAEKLRWLQLSKNAITDKAATTLATLPNLERLYLDHTAITETGMWQLAAPKRLNELSLRDTSISDEAASEFVNSNPQLRVTHRRARTTAGPTDN